MPYVNSSVIRYVDYNESTGSLRIRFASGKTYTYKRVPYIVYVGLLNAPSAGAFFNQFIRDVYPCS